MRTPTDVELDQLAHIYDPVKAHEYYERTKKLKGRKKATLQPIGFAAANAQRHEAAKPRQRRELAQRIRSLSSKLQKLEARIRELEHKEASENRKSKAKKERAAKEAAKPKTAAEKAEAAREAKKYRDKNQQKLTAERKTMDPKEAAKKVLGGGSSGKKASGTKKTTSLSELKSLATRVRGQIAVAKQKLNAL